MLQGLVVIGGLLVFIIAWLQPDGDGNARSQQACSEPKTAAERAAERRLEKIGERITYFQSIGDVDKASDAGVRYFEFLNANDHLLKKRDCPARRPKKVMETYGDCGTATGRDDRTNEKIHTMTCRGYGKNAMLLAFVVRNREPQLEIRLTPADIDNETKRFRDDQDGSVAVAILIDKRPVLNRFALWDAPSDMALLYETDAFHSLLKDVAKGYKATIQIGEMVGGTVELGGSAAAIRDLRERARGDGISF